MSQPQNQIVIYQPDETLRIDVRLENETVWLTQARMGELFGVDRSVINRHIRNIYATAELLEGATCAKIAQVQKEGGRMVSRIQPYYNLDVIIAVGYRVNSPQATHFRIWATGVLKEVLLRGYAVNERIDRLERRVAKADRVPHWGLAQGLGKGAVRFFAVGNTRRRDTFPPPLTAAPPRGQVFFPPPALLPLPLRPWRTLREPFFRPPSAMARQDAAPPEVESMAGARLQKTLAFSLVFRFPDTSRAGRPRPDIPSAFLPLSMSAKRFSWFSMLVAFPFQAIRVREDAGHLSV